jgi:hypothetical protein
MYESKNGSVEVTQNASQQGSIEEFPMSLE